MAFDRYDNVDVIGFGELLGTSRSHVLVRQAVADGSVGFSTVILQGEERLDTLAGKLYGDGRYWWIIAAASGIGWAPQVPPGTVLKVPNLTQVARLFA